MESFTKMQLFLNNENDNENIYLNFVLLSNYYNGLYILKQLNRYTKLYRYKINNLCHKK